jgi:alkylation response protein AidB-like acyl-CoA dehydrogenase
MTIVRRLLAMQPPAADTLDAWWRETREARETEATPVDRALAGGVCADRLGFAFAAGYSEALRALVPDLVGITALCITEEQGNHPRAIATTLRETAPGTFELTGRKKWATAGPLASTLLVAATTGVDAGRHQLRLVRIAANAPGVRMTALTTPFVPEIPHAEIELDRVAVRAADLLPGDAYAEYIKPFRTVEDIHVHAALLGYLIGAARRYALPVLEQLIALAVATRALAAEDRGAPELHVALAGTLALLGPVVTHVEQLWRDGEERQRWQRDRALLSVAASAREARLATAWERLRGTTDSAPRTP